MIRHAGEVMVAVARERLGRTLVVTFLPPDAVNSGVSKARAAEVAHRTPMGRQPDKGRRHPWKWRR